MHLARSLHNGNVAQALQGIEHSTPGITSQTELTAMASLCSARQEPQGALEEHFEHTPQVPSTARSCPLSAWRSLSWPQGASHSSARQCTHGPRQSRQPSPMEHRHWSLSSICHSGSRTAGKQRCWLDQGLATGVCTTHC